jgi:autotransporter-associated beta strand protein
MDVHFSMLRGSPGFYVATAFSHRNGDSAMSMGETRDNIYAGSIFNWMCVDAARNRLMEVQPGSAAIGVQGAPVEVSLWTNGIYKGRYEDKYKYSADFGVQRVWGWASVGASGSNVGLWNVSASAEYYSDGPMKRDLMSHIGTTILNYYETSHYGSAGTDCNWTNSEIWAKVYGPYFIYCNNITNSITATNQAAQALYADALAQAQAEATAWPYSWFANTNYASAAQRGVVSGQFVINDAGNPNATASNLWVGLVQQPVTDDGVYDFQQWMKTCQFWAKTDSNGNFTIPNVIGGTNYTLYAFGQGAEGTFMSQNQSGGHPPLLYNLPATPFSVTVTNGVTNSLGTVTWTPSRVGATVFEIGYPDRTGAKFRHGEDYWVGDIGPSPSDPSPVWSKWLEYPFDFPSGPDYIVGQSRWTTDWNFVQPVVTSSTGTYNDSGSTITFYLPTAPTNGAEASLYLATASDFEGAIIVSVNGTNLGSLATSIVTATPNSIPSSGYIPAYSGSGNESDTTIREGINSVMSDERITFPASLLQTNENTITLSIRQVGGTYFADHAMYDYLRLELTGYVPPPPSSVAAYAGNNCNLVCWPVTPGATSYNIYRTTTSGSGYSPVAGNLVGPVCGSGLNNAVYLDTNAVNGTPYYYVVQSVNPTGTSTNSPESPGATPSASLSAGAPATPSSVTVSSTGHQSVALNWSASAGADFYTIYRSTLVDNGGGVSNVLRTIVLNNNTTGTSYTDTSPTDGSIYSYFVTATGAGGTSANSSAAVGVPLPAAPASAPGSLTGKFTGTTNITLSWSAVSGTVGYVISRATSASGPFTLLQSVAETTYLDTVLVSGTYYYEVAAVNAAGVSANATVTVTAPPAAPASLSAIPGNALVILSWSAVANATGYFLYSGTSSSNENVVVVADFTGTSYTNTLLTNGTTYYYVVAATNAAGLGPDSPEASATPSTNVAVAPISLTWKGDGSANIWNVSGATNWLTNGVATVFNNGDSVTFDNTGSNNVAVSLVGALQPSLVTFNASKNYTFSGSGSIAGTNQLVLTGTGTLTVSTTNSYSGGTILNAGTLTLNNAAAAGTNTITLNAGTLSLGAVIGNPLYVAGTATLLPGSIDYNNSTLSGDGLLNVTITGANTFSAEADMSAFSGTNELGASTGYYRFYGSFGSAAAAFDLGTGTVTMLNRNGDMTIQLGSVAGGTGTTLTGASSVNAPTTYVVGGNNNSTTFSGRITDNDGITVLVKTGSGIWTLTGTNNTYSGGTTINGGTLLVNNLAGSATGTNLVAVNSGGTLAGTGIISGAVAVNTGGVFASGNPLGTLTISNNLTLATGSTTLIQVQHLPLTNNAAKITGTLAEVGTLWVTNTGTSALTNGDSFQLFNATSYSGAFTSLVLPSLAGNLLWNTNTVNTSGALSVVALTSPTIAHLNLAGGNLIISGSGGVNSWPYYLMASTNLTLPAAQWTRVATNQFDTSGNFVLTNAINSTWPQTFYRLQLQ